MIAISLDGAGLNIISLKAC